MRFILVALLLVSISDAGATSAGQKYFASCRYYGARAAEMQCSQSSYLIQFGEFYCREFDHNRYAFSVKARKMLRKIKICLQESLEYDKQLTCSNVKAKALVSHVECYREVNFCEMPFTDKLILGAIVNDAWFDPDYRLTMLEILSSCFDPLSGMEI